MESGIRTIPLVLSLSIGAVFSGVLTSKIGYIAPFMYASVVGISVSAGLFTTLSLSTDEGKWIGYQILYGLSTGLGIASPTVIAQTVLVGEDIAMGIALTYLVQQLAGAVFLSAGQNIFLGDLMNRLSRVGGNLDPTSIANSGATSFRSIVSPSILPAVLTDYNLAVRQVFIAALVLACLSAVGAIFVQWKKIGAEQGSREKSEKSPEKNSIETVT